MAKDKEYRKEVLANLRDLSLEDLKRQAGETTEELFWMRFKNNAGQLDKPYTLRLVRQKLARLNTILREKNETVEERAR